MTAPRAFALGWLSGIVALLAAVAGLLAAYGRIIDAAPARNVRPAPQKRPVVAPAPSADPDAYAPWHISPHVFGAEETS